jgi:hypothetical protein
VDLKVLNDQRAPTIASGLITVVSAVAARNYVVTAVCTDNASNDASMLNELQTFSLQRPGTLPTIGIPCVAVTANSALGGFATESRSGKLCDTRKLLSALPGYTGATFSDIPRLREECWCSLGDITNYIVSPIQV